jgi:hypothetical protein
VANLCAARPGRAWPALLLAALCGPASARTGFEARCEEAAAASSVTLASHDDGWRIDNSLSLRQLTRMKRPAVQRGWVLGLTHTEAQVTVQVGGTLQADPSADVECVAPRVSLDLRYPPIVIYVAAEFVPHTCAYREILAHEQRHLAAYLTFLPDVEGRMRARLAERFDGKPVYARRGQALGVLQRELDGRWLPYVKAAMRDVETLQAAIDSPQEYARLSRVCAGEVQSLIGSTRHATPR